MKNVKPGTLGEIYAYGCRNPQRFSWDPKNGNMYVADIGQDVIEKVYRGHSRREPRVEHLGGDFTQGLETLHVG